MRSILMLGLMLFSGFSSAASITYEMHGLATGAVNGAAFTDAAFTITSTINPDNVQNLPPLDYVANGEGRDPVDISISIEGFGTAIMTQEFRNVAIYSDAGQFYIANHAGGFVPLLAVTADFLIGIDLNTEFSEAAVAFSSSSGPPAGAVQTDMGDIYFSVASNMTLSATAVPVPAAVWLFGSALAGLGWLRRKQAG